MPGVGEALDLADLGDDQHRRVTADAADLSQDLDAIVSFGALIDLGAGRFELAVEVVDQRQQAIQTPAGRLAQLERLEKLAASLAEPVGTLAADAVLGEDRVDAVLERRAHPGQRDPVAQKLPQLA